MVQAQNESKGKTTTPQRNQGEATKTVPKSGDMGGLKLDNMSDAQVQDAMKKMQESGYTEQQIEQAAKARGMDDAEIQRFKQRMGKPNTAQGNINNELLDKRPKSELPEADTSKHSLNPNPRNSRIFGANLFSSGSSSFEPNLKMATPENYVIGPEDQLLLDITGDNEVSYKLPVTLEGYINLEYVGRIAVGGLTIDQAKSKIRARMAGTYPALNSGRTQMALNLGNIRSIKVIMTGEVLRPGTYTLPSVASVFNALYEAGGPSDNGTYRNIQVIRNNRVIATIDLYDFLINGIQGSNVRLQDQDVIHIPVYQIHVDVVGEVKRSAIYEIRAGESLVDVLKYAGGFSDMAYKAKIKIIQNTPSAQKVIVTPLADFPNFRPKNGDRVFVSAIFDRFENQVQINGAVARGGIFELTPGLTVSKLIEQADGLMPDVFMNNGYIIRMNDDYTNSVVSFNVAEAMNGGMGDIPLKKDDIVQISSIFDLRDEYKVSIGGEVRQPGSFPYGSNLTVSTLIQMSGGFKEGASSSGIEVARRIRRSDLTQKGAQIADVITINVDKDLKVTDTSFVLQPFDIVTVRNEIGFVAQQQVQIIGEVIHPGLYTIKTKNERISDIVQRAGGLTAYAYSKGASLKRPGPGDPRGYNPVTDNEEEKFRDLNLSRLKQFGAVDSSSEINEQSRVSDLVGIELDKILKNPNSKYDLLVESGDVIRIPTTLQTIKVTGEVLRPISVVYQPGRSFKYYINSAGGFTRNAYKRGSFVSKANGSVEGTKQPVFFNNYPDITPGSVISVPQKAKKEGMNAQGWVGMATAIASLAAIIFALAK